MDREAIITETLEKLLARKVGMAMFVPEGKMRLFAGEFSFRPGAGEKVFHPETYLTNQFVLL